MTLQYVPFVLYGEAMFICMVMVMLGQVLKNNDPPAPGVGLRTQRLLTNADLRRRLELELGRLMTGIGIAMSAVSILALGLLREIPYAALDAILVTGAMIVLPLYYGFVRA